MQIQEQLKKNVAAELMFAMRDSATPANFKTGLTVADTGYYKDGAGAWTSLPITDTVTEIGASCMYTIELSQAEMNHDLVMIKLTSAGAEDLLLIIRTFGKNIDDVALASVCTEARLAELAAANLPSVTDAIKQKTDNLPSGIEKNVALPAFEFYMVYASDHVSPALGKTITGEINKDGGGFAAITNSISEVGSGVYKVVGGLTQAEMNANVVTLKFTEANCDQRMITIHTS